MGVVFDGKKFSTAKTELLKRKAEEFAVKNNRRAKLATIYDPNNEAGRIYTAIKEKKAAEIGVVFEKYSIEEFKYQIKQLVPMLNEDKSVDGIMVQVPIFGEQESGRVEEYRLIHQIDPKKDVDGLRDDSLYLPAVVRAVIEILNSKSEVLNKIQNPKFVVLGSKGFVGSKLLEQFHKMDVPTLWGMDSDTLDVEKLKQADVIISATGVSGAFTADMVKDGVVIIDVGYPKGDFDPGVAQKASFFTPVPGGVGPVTVVSLFGNLLNL